VGLHQISTNHTFIYSVTFIPGFPRVDPTMYPFFQIDFQPIMPTDQINEDTQCTSLRLNHSEKKEEVKDDKS
jgi:hypothetical protein